MMKINHWLLVLFIFCLNKTLQAQIFEPFNFRYRYAPSTGVNDSDEPIFDETERDDFHFFELTAKYPITFKNSNALFLPELVYKRSEFSFRNWPEQFQLPRTSNLTRFSIKSVLPVNDKWNILAVGFASQGTNEAVGWDLGNNMYRGGLGFLINNKAGNQIGTSILYISEVDLVVAAFIYKGRSKNERWQFNIEAPQLSIVEYNISNNSRLRLEQRLDNERYFFERNTFDESFNLTTT
ncbi:MAG: hypothetical protein AAF363_11135 [Bacteroidota bacterium]